MSIEDIKKRFVDEIKLRAYDDKYVDKNEEREILQIAIQQGIGIDSARSALAAGVRNQGYILESTVLRTSRTKSRPRPATTARSTRRSSTSSSRTPSGRCRARRTTARSRR